MWRARDRTRNRGGTKSLLSVATARLGTAPLHYWDFTANRALFSGVDVGAVTSTPNWSFSRASTGYAQTLAGTLVNFGSGVPRITNKGLLVEDLRTNLVLQSQTLDNATWIKNSATVNANAYTAPDATLTMDGVQASAGLFDHFVRQNITWTAAVHSASAYVKYVNHQWVALQIFDGTTNCVAAFDLLNGVVGAVSNVTSAIESLGGGVYRISITTSAPLAAAAGFTSLALNNSNTANIVTWTAAGTELVGVWGAQAEAGSASSSYITTTTVTASRQPDTASLTSPSVAYPLSVYTEFNRTMASFPSNTIAFNLDDATAGERTTIIVDATASTLQPLVSALSTTQYNVNISPALAANTTTKLAVRVSAASANSARDNVLQTASGAITVPLTPTRLFFGMNPSAAAQLNGYLLRVAIFNTALADAALQRSTR